MVRAAAEAGLALVALTDHDTADGWDEAVSALPARLRLVLGVEVSAAVVRPAPDGGRPHVVPVHLVALGADVDDPALAPLLAQARESRHRRLDAMVAAVAADHPRLEAAAVAAQAGGSPPGRPHLARALVAAGLVADVDEAFGPGWIGPGGRYWRSRPVARADDVVRAVTAAGGRAVLAHPFAGTRGEVVDDADVAELGAAGLAGLEVHHPDHREHEVARAGRLAAALDLVGLGVSDFHGTGRPQPLAARTTAADVAEQLLDGVRVAVVEG